MNNKCYYFEKKNFKNIVLFLFKSFKQFGFKQNQFSIIIDINSNFLLNSLVKNKVTNQG